MKKVKLLSSVLAASIMLSSLSVTSVADDSSVVETFAGDTSTITDNTEVSITDTDITDTSLTVLWNSVPNAETYTVICNNSIVAEGITDNRYEITDLQPGSEFFISIQAFDAVGNMISESEEKVFYTDLTVNSDMRLTENLTVNSLCVNSGTLNLNGYSLTVNNDAYITDSSAYIDIDSGSLFVNGNLNFENSGECSLVGGLQMTNSKGAACVRGDINLLSLCDGTLSAGTLELCGNFNSNFTGNWDSFNTSSSHKLILSGLDTQTITLPANSKLSVVEVKNFSDGGVIFTNQVSIFDLRDNGCKVSLESEENTVGWTLNSDETFDGNMLLVAGTLDLNGHKLTITGDLLQSSGTVLVNGGELVIQGNYKLQSSAKVNDGILNMSNDADIVRVSGDFVMQSNQSHDGKLSAGTLEIGGDLLQSGNDYNFHTTGNHTVLLNGTRAQTINISSSSVKYSKITNLKIENTSDEGVAFSNCAYVTGDLYNTDSIISESSNIYIVSSTKFVDSEWNYDVTVAAPLIFSHITIGGNVYGVYGGEIKLGGNIHIKGNYFVDCIANINGYTLDVDGDIWVGSQLNINRGKINVAGNFNLCQDNGSPSYGSITMKYAKDVICVNGNVIFYSNNRSSILTDGTIEVKGDFIQKYDSYEDNFYASNNHLVVLSGDALQRVRFASEESRFNVLEVRNTSEAGVELYSKVQAAKIVSNDCNIRYCDFEDAMRVLNGDEVVEGDLILEEDALDLNGHTLTITGNLIHSSGIVNVNGGTLDVKGDYRIQREDGYHSKGKLIMTNESDIVRVAGDFVMQSTVSHKDCLTNGVLEIGGDFLQNKGSAVNFQASGNHTVVLNGSDEQTVSFTSYEYSMINNLKITNSSESGITFRGRVYVTGTIYNSTSVINRSENICAGAETVFENNEWNHSITFLKSRDLPDNLKIKGDVYLFAGTLPANSEYGISGSIFSKDLPETYTLSVMGDLYVSCIPEVNGGSIFVGGDLYFGTGSIYGISMDSDDDYILVNGNLYYNSSSNVFYKLSKGTLELKGDFIQDGSFSNEQDTSNEFKLVLSGDALQTIKTESDQFQFSIIDVDNHSEEGVYISSVINYVELRKNGCNVKFEFEDSPGWTLEADEVFEGDLTISKGVLDLNGHKLTVTGNFIQPGGTVAINNGELVVKGDYRIQNKVKDEYGVSTGVLKMINKSDIVRVSGNFVMQSSKSHVDNLTDGTLEIGGDLTVPSGSYHNNLYCTKNHTIVLNGTGKQNVYISDSAEHSYDFYRYDGSKFNNLKISNTSEDGVEFIGIVLIDGKLFNTTSKIVNSRNISATNSTVFEDHTWSGDISFFAGGSISTPLFVKGDVYLYEYFTSCSDKTYGEDALGINGIDSGGYEFLVDGNVYAYDTLNLPHESAIIISGNLILADNPREEYRKGNISLYGDSKLFVGGNLVCSSTGASSFGNGTLEIRGDMIFSNDEGGFKADSNHTTIFSGEKLQTIIVANPTSAFDIVEIKNNSADGVCFESPVSYTELIDNGCKVTQVKNAVSGWTLSDDEIIDGDLNLIGGVLDLNGYKLTVNGNLIQSSGTVFVNGGELCVSGDYRIQTKRGEEYSNSFGILKMINESDIVKVSGSFVMQSTVSREDYLSAGTLEIGGDLVAAGGYSSNFKTSGLHTIVLNGTKKQRVEISSYLSISNLMIRNTSSEGVEFVNITYVMGKLYDTSSKITNGKNLYVTDTTDFADNAWSADITFSKTPSLVPDFYIGGSLYLDSVLTLNGDMTVDGSLHVNKDINLNGHTLNVGENLRLDSMIYVNGGKLYIDNKLDISREYGASSGYLYMNNADDYVLVNGDVYIYSYENTYFTRGTLEIKGDFTQKDYGSDANISFTGKVILSGTEIQKITVENARFYFKTLEVTKPINAGYVFNRTPMWETLIENIADTEAPSAPSKLSFIDSTSTSIRIKWVGSKDNISDCAYDVYRDGKLIAVTSDTEFIDIALIPYTEYTYYVVAHDASGNASEQSNTLTARTNSDISGLLQPTNLSFKIRADGSVYLTWAAPVNADNTVEYNIYRNGDVIGTTGSAMYVDRSVEQGYHEYCVEAVDENSSAVSASVFVDNMPPEKPVLYISRITPTYISLTCDSTDNVEMGYFDIYRDGKLIGSTKSREYTDNSVAVDGEYSYYAIAVDKCGNMSEPCDPIAVTTKCDETGPEIIVCEQTLTEDNKMLKVTCIDDVMLSVLTVQIKLPSSEEWVSLKPRLLNRKSRIVSFDLTDNLTDSGVYQVRVELTDASGNTSTVESSFGYVKNELSDITVSVKAEGCSVALNWSPASDKSDVYYEIWRIDPDGTEQYIASTNFNELSYTDVGLCPLAEYSYRVIARDENLYSCRSETVIVHSGLDTNAPLARLIGNDLTIEGYPIAFDGTLSEDNFGIKSYSWDFGDGCVGEGTNIEHVFSKAGTYKVTLTVLDESGNADDDVLTVTVNDSTYCITEIQVLDENGATIPNAAAYCELPDSTESMYYSDSNGVIPLVTKSGTYDFYFFADKYMPYKKSVTLQGVSIDSNAQKIILTKSDLVSAEFDYRELELDEAIERGIDVSKPENQHLSVVTIKVDDAESDDKNKYDVIVNQSGDFLMIDSNNAFTVKSVVKQNSKKKTSQGNVSTSTSIRTLNTGIENRNSPQGCSFMKTALSLSKTLVGVSVTEFSWQKNFYEISISITNNATDDFCLDNCNAAINLPNGLSLANTRSNNSLLQSIETISGGTTKTVSWIVKGDRGGSYPVSVSFTGILSPLNIPIEALFESADPIVVKGNEALKLTLKTSGLKTNFELTNTASYSVNNVKVNISEYSELNDADRIIYKYPSGMIEVVDWVDEEHSRTAKKVYLPVGIDYTKELAENDFYDLRTLNGHESIIGIIYRN